MRSTAIVFLSLLLPSSALADAPADLVEGLDNGPYSELRMKYEVTFMKFDIAYVGAKLPGDVGHEVGLLVQGKEYSKELGGEVAALLLDSESVLLSMDFLRDSGIDKFMKGHQRNLDAAYKTEIITEAEKEKILLGIEQDMAPIQERGVKKHDQVYYRIDGDQVRTVYIDAEGEVLIDVTHVSASWARGLTGSFFCRESKFRKKLIKPLFEKK
jgi:hypothetical protein